ncbi:hypothetical protein J4G48_0040495 [Bradyrhizobium barranii subsp. apii]|uniref:hypothetical protein n=1 Tax=Bradyrhizobium barranii TaxID=2992140 RepID=UPI001AA1B4B7|nr:hypothetical protein [Bradyrhizobium barranii]UPT95437.1 hypothetical protein J4G48_0040495 [Bradyrhizobium barranii subsp. apii]
MKKRAFITLTLAVDLDMVAGPWDKPSDWTDAIQRQFHAAACYSPEITVHEIIEQKYDYVEGEGYVRPVPVTLADREVLFRGDSERIIAALSMMQDADDEHGHADEARKTRDLIERLQALDERTSDMPERNSEDGVDAEGCPTWE